MSQVIQKNHSLAEQIKSRRLELGLTIKEAASRAGISAQTWSEYETGRVPRTDKHEGICRALGWQSLPEPEQQDREKSDSIPKTGSETYEYWSSFLEDNFGNRAAIEFAVGSDIVLDYIEDDLRALASLPAGTHLGQLKDSLLDSELPKQFLMHYDYEFLYRMRWDLMRLREQAKSGDSLVAHSVMEELILYLCYEEGVLFCEMTNAAYGIEENTESDDPWIFDLFGDMDIISYLYGEAYLNSVHPYHFTHWSDQQFYTQ